MQDTEYSEAEVKAAATLMARALPAMLQGKSLEEALRGVLARDIYIWKVMNVYPEIKKDIKEKLAEKVYNQIRAATATK